VCNIVRFPAASTKFVVGIITALTQPNPEALRTVIRETRAATDKPFGVNLTILPSINPPDYEGFARVAVEEGVKIFETAGNNRVWSHAFISHNDLDMTHSGKAHRVLQVAWVHCDTQVHHDSTCQGPLPV
jgi:NAD(P)H-dependent flavin oxidoreductase YrpB (nitropropane dioxygenase family)